MVLDFINLSQIWLVIQISAHYHHHKEARGTLPLYWDLPPKFISLFAPQAGTQDDAERLQSLVEEDLWL